MADLRAPQGLGADPVETTRCGPVMECLMKFLHLLPENKVPAIDVLSAIVRSMEVYVVGGYRGQRISLFSPLNPTKLTSAWCDMAGFILTNRGILDFDRNENLVFNHAGTHVSVDQLKKEEFARSALRHARRQFSAGERMNPVSGEMNPAWERPVSESRPVHSALLIDERVKHLDTASSAAHRHFENSTKWPLPELVQLAHSCARRLDIRLDRSYTRRWATLLLWFHENWERVEALL